MVGWSRLLFLGSSVLINNSDQARLLIDAHEDTISLITCLLMLQR